MKLKKKNKMKYMIYILITLLVITAVAADEFDDEWESIDHSNASWGDVDFRILESDNDLVFPIVIDINNYLEEELEGVLVIETLTPEASFGQSDYEEDIIIPEKPELKYVDFEVVEGEEEYDVWVWVYVDDEPAYRLYNSIMRTSEKDIKEKDELPLLPGEVLKEEIEEYLEEFHEKYPENVTVQEVIETELREKRSRMIIGILIAVAAFALVGLIAWFALKKDDYGH